MAWSLQSKIWFGIILSIVILGIVGTVLYFTIWAPTTINDIIGNVTIDETTDETITKSNETVFDDKDEQTTINDEDVADEVAPEETSTNREYTTVNGIKIYNADENVFYSFGTTQENACQSKCTELDECVGFSFNPVVGLCELSATIDILQSSDGTIFSGFKCGDDNCNESFQLFDQMGMSAQNISTSTETSSFDCESVCKSNDDCIAYEYNTQTGLCNTASRIIYMKSATNYTAGIRQNAANPESSPNDEFNIVVN